MKNENKKNDKGALSNGNNSGKADKWKAPKGPGLPTSLAEIEETLSAVKLGTAEEVKAGNGKPFPKGLIDRAMTAFKSCLKTMQGEQSSLLLGRELWEREIFAGLTSVNPDEERAETLTSLVLLYFPAGKDYSNAVSFRKKFETLPVKLQNYLTFCGTSKDEVITLSNLKETEAGFLVTSEWLELCVNCSGTFGNLKKFYTFNTEANEWETVEENRERRKDKEEGTERPKVALVASLPSSVSEEEAF